MPKIVEVVPRIGVVAKTKPLWQYDSGQIIRVTGITLPATYKAEFSNSTRGQAIATVQTTDEITVPAQFLQSGNPVYVWLVVVDESSRTTEYALFVPVAARANPTDTEPTPEEQSEIDQALAALDSGVSRVEGIADAIPDTINEALEAAKESGEFDGADGQDGISPTVTITEIAGGHRIAIIDEVHPNGQVVDVLEGTNGRGIVSVEKTGTSGLTDTYIITYTDSTTSTFTVTNGQNGIDGVTFTSSVSAEGVLSWTNDGGLPNPQSINIKGPPGSSFAVHICSAQEYDATTRVPTIYHPIAYTFYLVPAADGSSGNMYLEWIYTNGAWEKIGNVFVDLSNYQPKITASGILKGDGQGGVTAAVEGTDYGTYSKPSGGIPASDLAPGAIPRFPPAYSNVPQPLGTANAGSSSYYSRGDHVHAMPTAADIGAYVKPQNGIPASDFASGAVPVQDVQVDGVSILNAQGVANMPYATSPAGGIVKIRSDYGLNILRTGEIYIYFAADAEIKQGLDRGKPIVPVNQHTSAFYGFAKAAGDSTQSQSNNAVGAYTESAKSAISTMLNGPVTVSGSTPTINAMPGVQYICGECSTLDITLPASGCVDVVFTSGSTPTVLTVTPPTGITVKWANGFDPTALEANTTYEINIMDGLGVAASWT